MYFHVLNDYYEDFLKIILFYATLKTVANQSFEMLNAMIKKRKSL